MNGVPELNLPVATPAQLFVGTLGKILIWAGMDLFGLGLIASLFFPKAKRLATTSFVLGCGTVIAAFITLGSLFVRNQYEFKYIYDHSQVTDPLKYKIAAIWSGQEGSFLLWATTASIFGLLTIWGTGIYKRWFTVAYSLFLASICGILAYESPFILQTFHGKAYILPTGMGMNASLQNYWVVIHPPTIFMGFGALTVLFAYAFSALILRNYKDWVPKVRPWALVSLSIVGIGLCMGGFWAYETLGWGGFWKWDPVEDVSFVPWCMTVAFVHGLIVQGTRGKWYLSNLLLGGLPFLLYVYGTFLTRAGFLDGVSIHSFASMEHTAHMVLLTFCAAVSLGFLGLWAFRCFGDSKDSDESSIRAEKDAGSGTHREGWYRIGSILISLIAIATAIGMSVPLFQYVAHKPTKVVDEHLYHLVLAWFFIPTMLMMAVAPFVSWRKMAWAQLGARIFNVFSVTIGLLGIIMIVMNNPKYGVHLLPNQWIDFPFHRQVAAMPWIMFLTGLCLFTAVGNLWRIIEMWRSSKPALGSFLAHMGVATAMAGLIISRGLERTQRYALQEQDVFKSLGNVDEAGQPIPGKLIPYVMMLHDVDPAGLQNSNNKLTVDVMSDGLSYVAHPGFYFAGRTPNGEEKQMAWPDVHHELSHDSYLSIGGQQIPASDPVNFLPGETQEFKNVFEPHGGPPIPFRVTYLKMERQGQVGTTGTRFIADVLIQGPNGAKPVLVKPAMRIAEGGGPQIEPVIVDSDFFMTLMSMDPATHGVTLQMNYVRPLYWVDLIYKPMVILVWIGAGIMTLGGLMSAFYRARTGRAATRAKIISKVEEPARKEEAPTPVQV